MYGVKKCPYCGADNKVSNAEFDNDNKTDFECRSCLEVFEVYVEYSPSYEVYTIDYVKCDKCKREVRDDSDYRYLRKYTHPYPKNNMNILCTSCYTEEIKKELYK